MVDEEWSLTSPGREFFAQKLVSDKATVLVAKADNKIIGYLVGTVQDVNWRKPKLTAEIINLYVCGGYRNKGIGAILISRFTKNAEKLGAKRLRVMQHFHNKRGFNFYKGYGFKEHALILEHTLGGD